MTQFTCQLHSPISCVHRLHIKPFHECFHVNSGLNLRKKSALLSGINTPRTSLVIEWSTRMNSMAADTESGFPCDEEDERRDELGPITEQILPPWGGSEIRKDSNFEPRGLDQPKTGPQEKAMLNVDSVHFLEETDEEILSKRVLVLSRTNKARSALELLRSMELSGLRPDPHACNSLLSCLFRNDLVDDGLTVFELMKTKKMTTGHTYSLVLKAVADAKGCNAALRMFHELEEEPESKGSFDLVVYNTMISVCGRVNNWLEALRLWRSMKENGLVGTRVTYSVLVCTFVRCGQNELALDAYNEMVQGNFDPGSDTMQAIIGACAKEAKWGFALSVFEGMLKRGLKPNITACNALINSLGKAGEVKLAFRVFEAMKSLGHSPDSYTWKALLGALYMENRHDDALRLFESIGQEPGSRLNLHLYNIALVSCSKRGLWDRGLQLLWQMEAEGTKASTSSYNLVIRACEKARKPDVAMQVYEHMAHQKCEPDTFTHLILIRVCIWGSFWAEIDQILSRAAPDASLYNEAIQGMCLRGRLDSAKKLYGKMRDLGLRSDGKTRALMLQNLTKNIVKHKYRQRKSHYYKPISR